MLAFFIPSPIELIIGALPLVFVAGGVAVYMVLKHNRKQSVSRPNMRGDRDRLKERQ